MRHPTWQYLIDWCSRMAQKYGGIIWEDDKAMDWGQAICRAAYGPDWVNNADFKQFNEMPADEPAPDYVIETARQWEAGEWPEWVTKPKIEVNNEGE